MRASEINDSGRAECDGDIQELDGIGEGGM